MAGLPEEDCGVAVRASPLSTFALPPLVLVDDDDTDAEEVAFDNFGRQILRKLLVFPMRRIFLAISMGRNIGSIAGRRK